MRRQAATGQPDRARNPQSLEPDQTAELAEPLADKYGAPVSTRQFIDIVKARTPDHARRRRRVLLFRFLDEKVSVDVRLLHKERIWRRFLANTLQPYVGQCYGI